MARSDRCAYTVGAGLQVLNMLQNASMSLLSACSDGSDACEGRTETCLSLSLEGAEGVVGADQIKVLIWRKEQPFSPTTPLGSKQEFPFKVAVLWPDGPANLSVRSFLDGSLHGVSGELTLDLRNGQRAQRKLTLFPPLASNAPQDMARSKDFSVVRDMTLPPDLSSLPDLSDQPDLSDSPDLSIPPDLSSSPDL